MREEVAPLHDYLGDALDQDVRLDMSDSYRDLADRLLRGDIEYAMLPPLLYVQTKEREPGITPLVIREFDGAMMSDGLLLVSMQRDITDLADLRGETFCFPDKNSTTGNFLPRAYLRKQGYDPEAFIGEIRWSGDHLQVMRDLVEGKCAAGATYSGAFIAADQIGIKVSKLRTLAITGHVPQDVVCAGPGVPEEDARRVREALLAFDPQEVLGEDQLGETQRLTGFVEATDDGYDDLRRAIAEDADRE